MDSSGSQSIHQVTLWIHYSIDGDSMDSSGDSMDSSGDSMDSSGDCMD